MGNLYIAKTSRWKVLLLCQLFRQEPYALQAGVYNTDMQYDMSAAADCVSL